MVVKILAISDGFPVGAIARLVGETLLGRIERGDCWLGEPLVFIPILNFLFIFNYGR